MGNRQATYNAVNSDIERRCIPEITHRDVNNLIRELKPYKQVKKNGDIMLLEYCHTVIRDYQQEEWSNAIITILCPKSHREISFFSGNQQNKFEVSLLSGDTPTCVKKTYENALPSSSSSVPVPVGIVSPPTPSGDIVKPGDFYKCFLPPMKPSTIQAVLAELDEMLNDDERQQVLYCRTMIIKETEKTGQSQWNDVTITIMFNRGWKIVISTKSDYKTTNEYEVFKDSDGPIHTMTKQAPSSSSSSVPVSVDKGNPSTPSGDIGKPRDFYKWFSPPIRPSSIQAVLRELTGKINDDERQLLQYCTSMIAEETEKTGQGQWNDVTITILSDRGWKIVISTKYNYQTTNEYEVWKANERAIHRMTKQGWSEYAWSGYSQLPSMDTFASAAKAIKWWK